MSAPIFVAKTNRRELLIGVLAGAVLLGLIVLGFVAIGHRVPNTHLTGTIAAKHFQPQEEQQIEIGKAGMHERQIDGTYTLEIRVEPENKTYTVWVDKTVYEERKVGDEFRFPRPLSAP